MAKKSDISPSVREANNPALNQVVGQRIMSRRMATALDRAVIKDALVASGGGGATNPTYSSRPYPAYGVTVMMDQEDDCGPDM